ncbi:MAG: nucleotidyltransferase family protein [Clostridiaceae bacterium]|jgi:predicted nucleotidyltransferase|nr:nucleotidyltransferase family protein [Clostridiaceae bacterium]
MNIVSIIAEYNPLHLGHQYQLQEARRLTGSDSAVVVAMSGCFTQRGEPAITDKWSRTRMALDAGVDLVLELPFAYACASAERFARGGVRLLQATGLDSRLVFGSECGDLARLQQAVSYLVPESAAFQSALHAFLDEGLSFPAARQLALERVSGSPQLAGLLGQPNNILAIEYLKAMTSLPSSRLQPLTIQRRGQDDRAAHLPGAGVLPSATAIREAVRQAHKQEDAPRLADLADRLLDAMPVPALAELMARIQAGPGPVWPDGLQNIVLARLRSSDPDELEAIAGMGEGLARRLIAAAQQPGDKAVSSWQGLLADAATRRFTRTRIQRALMAMLAGLSQADLDAFDAAGGPTYIRVLGFSRRGRYLLKLMRRLADMPIVTRASDFREWGGEPVMQRMAQLDLLAADLWDGAAGLPGGRDFDTPVIMQ